MLSSRQHVSAKRAPTSQKKLLEDEKTSKEKKKATTKEDEKGKSSVKAQLKTKTETKSLKTSSSASVNTPRTGPVKAATKTNQTLKSQMKRPPLTPPSKRVTKTQFFSSKTTYSTPSSQKSSDSTVNTGSSSVRSTDTSALKTKHKINDVKKPKTLGSKSDRERQSVKEFIKKVREENKKKTSKTEEPIETKRPGTATLTNPVVLKNVKDQTTESEVTASTSEDADYEDDFDSYESDFEAYSSESSSSTTEVPDKEEIISVSSSDDSESLSLKEVNTQQEKRISSASTDDEKKLDSGTFDLPEQKYKQVLHNIKETVEQENSRLSSSINPASLPDEGFEDVKSLGADACFINFTSAQKKLKQNKRRKRGEEILSMIKLDSFNFTLFDLAPMTYERYIKLYGQQNSVQASSQTGDDNVNEECQTDEIIKNNKWTQMPVTFSKTDVSQPNYLHIYKEEFVGTGNDDNSKTTKTDIALYNTHHYNKFIILAGQLLLNLLQENNSQSLKEMQHSDFPVFSSGYIECNTKTISILKHTFVTYIAYSAADSSQFLTVHKQQERFETSYYKNILCTWYLSNLNQPERMFVSYGEITCCCFSSADVSFIFGGAADGTISVWNTKKRVSLSDDLNNQPQVPHCVSDIGLGHISNVVSMHSVLNLGEGNDFSDAEKLCTLDCEGYIILWSVISKSISNTEDFTLLQNSKICLNAMAPNAENVCCTSMLVNKLDLNHLFVSTSMGYVVHTLISGTKAHPKNYKLPMASYVSCMAACPFSELYFLAGFQNGSVALYSRMVEKPLLIMIDKNTEGTVHQIEWSSSKPCVFYVKHRDVLNIWDLTISDMLPTCSVPFKESLNCIRLLSMTEQYRSICKSYMIMGYGSGELQLHILSKAHGQNSLEDFMQDVKKFLNYVNRL